MAGASPLLAQSEHWLVHRTRPLLTQSGHSVFCRISKVPAHKVDVVARAPGFIEERTFAEGREVKGRLVILVEQETCEAAVDQQNALAFSSVFRKSCKDMYWSVF
jgi:hypothetical protein